MSPDDIVIRPLTSQADYRACVALQKETWGADFQEAVPPSLLLVSQRVGGVAAGAFDADGRLVGFVFGLTGVENGEVVHWSDMLAVRPEARGIALGRRLKAFQRDAIARIGGRVIYWTYDPLVSRNAHLNFNAYGVRVVEYVPDMYGNETGSALHRAIGTDRLLVAWPVSQVDMERRQRETAAARANPRFEDAPVLGDPDRPDAPVRVETSPHLRIAVPRDIEPMMSQDPQRAATWRRANRDAFQRALRAGFSVAGFASDEGGGRGYYLLTR